MLVRIKLFKFIVFSFPWHVRGLLGAIVKACPHLITKQFSEKEKSGVTITQHFDQIQ